MKCLNCKEEKDESGSESGICTECLKRGRSQVQTMKYSTAIAFKALWHQQKRILRNQYVNGSNVNPAIWERNECVMEDLINAIITNIEGGVL